jgi:hypothetical protein
MEVLLATLYVPLRALDLVAGALVAAVGFASRAVCGLGPRSVTPPA